MGTTNLRESLYQCLQTKILIPKTKTDAKICLFKVPKNSIFTIKCYLELDSVFQTTTGTGDDAVTTNEQYNSFIQIAFSNGTVHVGLTDNDVVPYYKLDQAHLEHAHSAGQIANTFSIDMDNDANISNITFSRAEISSEPDYYAYIAVISFNQGNDNSKLTDNRTFIVRKELIYGDFAELISSELNEDTYNSYNTNSKLMVNVSQSTNDVSNGQYITADNISFMTDIVAKDFSFTNDNDYEAYNASTGYSSSIKGFRKITAYDIMAASKLGVGKRYVGTDNTKTDSYNFYVDANGNTSIQGTLSVTGTTTAAQINATKIKIGDLFEITDNKIVGSCISNNGSAFEPSASVVKLIREADLAYFQGSTNIIKLGTIATGIWNGTRLTSSYIPEDVVYKDTTQALTNKTYNGYTLNNACAQDIVSDTTADLSNNTDKLPTAGVVNAKISTAVEAAKTEINNKLGTQVTYTFDESTGKLTITVK